MNNLLQNKLNIIGSLEAVESLKTKEHARVLLVSDSHSKNITLINIIRHFGKECDALVLCGDTAFDICELLDRANESAELKDSIPPVFAFVQGNGDPSTIPVSFNIGAENPNIKRNQQNLVFIPSHQQLNINGTNVFITHGHLEGVDWGYENLGLEMKLSNCTTAFYGHTHIACQERVEDYTFINPGSCSRPRGGQDNSFAIVTFEKRFCDTVFLKIKYPLSDNPEYETYTPLWI